MRTLKLHYPKGHPYWQKNNFGIELPDGKWADKSVFSKYRNQNVGEEVEVYVREDGIYVKYFLCSSGCGKQPYGPEHLLVPKSDYDKIEYCGNENPMSQILLDDLKENGISHGAQ